MFQFSLKRISTMLVSARNQFVHKVAIITNRFKVAATPQNKRLLDSNLQVPSPAETSVTDREKAESVTSCIAASAAACSALAAVQR